MTSPLNPNAPSPPDPSANAANSWLDALVDAIADLSPAQRTRLWRRLHVTGLLPSVGPVTDRGRRGVARAVAEETILPSLPPPFVNADSSQRRPICASATAASFFKPKASLTSTKDR